MKKIRFLPVIVALAFYGCIGTDIVEESIVPTDLTISRSVDSLEVGSSFTFQADYFNMFGQKEVVPLSWSSSNTDIVTVTNDGLANGIARGSAYIRANFSELIDSVRVVVAEEVAVQQAAERNGAFRGNRGYAVNGAFFLREDGSSLELEFDTDFSSSNGPGLYVYLSNSTSNVNGGVEVGRLQRNSGVQTYSIPMTRAQLNTYDHVLIYCKPFGVPFGVGTFLN